MAGRWLPARLRDFFTREKTPKQKAEAMSWELLDKVAKEDMLADAPTVSDFKHERDHCMYQINLITVMLSKPNGFIQLEAPHLRERAAGYAKRMEQIDAILSKERGTKWVKR